MSATTSRRNDAAATTGGTGTRPTDGRGAVLRRAVGAEVVKTCQGRTPLLVLALALLMSTVTAYGFAVEYEAGVADGSVPADFVTGEVARAWMMTYLFAGVLGAHAAAREFDRRTVARTVLAAGGRTTMFAARTVATALVGLGFGLVAAVGAVVSCLVFVPGVGARPDWSADVVLSVLGVAATCPAAALLGSFVGWLVRSRLVAVLLVVVQTVLVEPGLQRLWPEPSSYLFTIALSAVYRDSKDGLLDVPVAVAVVVGWLVVLGAWALWRLRRRDLL